jgi:beta-lysine 5,6-aminomutase alpha subunit
MSDDNGSTFKGSAARGGSAAASKLDLDPGVVEACRAAAKKIADGVGEQIAGRTTVSVERSVTRLLGVDGANDLDAPLPNVLVDHVHEHGGLSRGVGYWLGNAMLQTGRSPQQIAEAVNAGELDLVALASSTEGEAAEQGEQAEEGAIRARVTEECAARLQEIRKRFAERHAMRQRLGEAATPLRYVLTATGDVYEDVVHARAVAEAGGDIVAVIRSTAQSLLDYVPYGPTTEGYGGTFATQANFRIMREAMTSGRSPTAATSACRASARACACRR